MLNEIETELGANYTSTDSSVLSKLLDEVKADALKISNRTNTDTNITLLTREIKECVKTIYLRRGTEDTKTLSESGKSSVFEDAYEKMRKDIINNGKRVVL